VLRTYARDGDPGSFLVELQRRRGCVRVFGRAYDRLCAHLGLRGLLAEDSPAAGRLRAMHADLALAAQRIAPAPPSAAAASVFPPAPAPPASTSMREALRDAARAAACGGIGVSGGEDGAATADDEEHDGDAEAERCAGAGDALAIVGACVSLAAALASAYDDVCAPAAQSLALLAASPRVRDALGVALAACLAAPAAGAEHGGLQALELLGGLVARAADPARSSLECRTAAAVALSQLTRNAAVADALLVLRSPLPALLDAAAAAEVCASGACLRRQLLRTVLHVVSAQPGPARLAAAQLFDVARRADALARAPHAGADARFDHIASKLVARLSPAVAAAASAPTL